MRKKGLLSKLLAPLLAPKNRMTTLSLLIICMMYGVVVFYSKAQTATARTLQTAEGGSVVSEVSSIGQPQIGGSFRLQKSLPEGKTSVFTEQDLKGKISIIFFGFTSCPDICPTELSKITLMKEELSSEEQEKLQVIFVSVDPKRDTPERLYNYVTSFDESYIPLTGTSEQIKHAADQYLVYYVVHDPEDDKLPMDYRVDHSGYTYVMDENGTYIKHFTTHTTIDEMVEILKEPLS